MGKWRALSALVLLTAPAYAQPVGQQVNVMGCVNRGVEIGCLIIKDHRTGKTYQINAATPPPDPQRNLVVRLTGTIAGVVDFCQQGPVLTDIKWSYTKMSCRRPKTK